MSQPATRASLMTRVACNFLAATKKRGYHSASQGHRVLMRGGHAAAPLPRSHGDRVRARWINGFVVMTMQPGALGVSRWPRSSASSTTVAPASAHEAATIYLHGGAYVHGIARQHWDLCADLADATRAPVHVALYGRAPRHTVREARAFMDAVLDDVASPGGDVRVHVAGDSAGGGLALLLAQAHRGDPRIAGLTLIAPALDLSMSNPELDVVEPGDPWLSRAGLRPMMAAWAGAESLTDPLVSPLFGPLDGLAPARLFLGDRDICWPDAKLLVQQAPESWQVSMRTDAGSPHVVPLLPTPEGRAARTDLLEWVNSNLRAALAR